MSITGCMIVKNESKNIINSLNCMAKLSDEIIVVDNGSIDDTVEIASKFGCVVIDGKQHKLDQARNLYLEASKTEWNFILDADEYILDKDCYSISKTVKELNDKDIMYFYMPRFEYLGCGKWATIKAPRLFRNHPKIRYNNFIVHASVTPSIVEIGGRAINIYTPIHHFDILMKDRTISKRENYIECIRNEIYFNQKNPFIWTQYTHLANEYTAIGRYEEAEILFKHAINLSNYAFIQATTGLAALYLVMKEYDLCYESCMKIINKPNTIKDRALILLSRWAYETNQIEKAIEYCETIIDIDYDSPHAFINLAFIISESQPRKAIEYIKKAISLNPMILNPIIYRRGQMPNMFNHQTSFISENLNLMSILTACYGSLSQPDKENIWIDLWYDFSVLQKENSYNFKF